MPSDDHITICGWSQCLPGVAAIFVERRTRRDGRFIIDIKRAVLWAKKDQHFEPLGAQVPVWMHSGCVGVEILLFLLSLMQKPTPRTKTCNTFTNVHPGRQRKSRKIKVVTTVVCWIHSLIIPKIAHLVTQRCPYFWIHIWVLTLHWTLLTLLKYLRTANSLQNAQRVHVVTGKH